MESSLINRNRKRLKRATRVRQNLRGTAEKPRLTVMKSNSHIAAQLIDDEKGITLAAANTQMKKFRGKKLTSNKEAEFLHLRIGSGECNSFLVIDQLSC